MNGNFSNLHICAILCDYLSRHVVTLHRNEEIQSVRHLQPKDVTESIVKARFMHRVYAEFREACRQVILAIADGQIAPLNPHDAEDTQVYIFNNIFVSRVVESKESYKVIVESVCYSFFLSMLGV